MKLFKLLCAAVTTLVITSLFTGCTAMLPTDLTATVSGDPEILSATDTDPGFRDIYLSLSAELFSRAAGADENSLLSPLSILYALGITANGAAGETAAELEEVLGLSTDALNASLFSYAKTLPDTGNAGVPQLHLANSVWFSDSDSLTVSEEFLRKCAGCYDAQAYKVDFTKQATVDSVNAWVKEHTHDMIHELAAKFPAATRLLLLNALSFEADWQVPYTQAWQVRDTAFTRGDGSAVTVSMMYSNESQYIEADGVTGFVKPYKERYAFVALLPDGDLASFIATLNGAQLGALIDGAEERAVNAGLPKFSYDCNYALAEILQAMGVRAAFDPAAADFSAMATSDAGLYLSAILHKTCIETGEQGTRAAAITAVTVTEGAMETEPPKTVILDRPFVYLILDTETGVPVFIGAVTDPSV